MLNRHVPDVTMALKWHTADSVKFPIRLFQLRKYNINCYLGQKILATLEDSNTTVSYESPTFPLDSLNRYDHFKQCICLSLSRKTCLMISSTYFPQNGLVSNGLVIILQKNQVIMICSVFLLFVPLRENTIHIKMIQGFNRYSSS